MSKTVIYKNQINEKNLNSALFLQYMEAYGFDKDNYVAILELFQSAKCSISQFLEGRNQYLLSEQVVYSELDELGIDGAVGYLRDDGICVPKSISNDDRFLHSKTLRPYPKYSYRTPSMVDFDVIIGAGSSPYLSSTANTMQDKYLGFCADIDSDIDLPLRRYKHLLELLNRKDPEYTLEHDTVSSLGKTLYLVRKKTK